MKTLGRIISLFTAGVAIRGRLTRKVRLGLVARSATIAVATIASAANATDYIDSFTVDPTTMTCGYFTKLLDCGVLVPLAAPIAAGRRVLAAGDSVTVTVKYTSTLVVPGSTTSSLAFTTLPDNFAVGGPSLPGPNTATVTSTLNGYVGPTPVITGPYTASTLHQYLAVVGAGFGYGSPASGFSLDGYTTRFDIVTGDPTPIYYAGFGYASELAATPKLLSDINGGAINHPVILPSGLTGSLSSNISGGTYPSEQFYSFNWDGGLFQTDGSITGANPLADFQFQLRDPYTHSLLYSLTLNAGDGFSGRLSNFLAAGSYEIGMFTNSPYDPRFTINFNTPVAGVVPELATWTMMIVGFGLVGGVTRRHRVAFPE